LWVLILIFNNYRSLPSGAITSITWTVISGGTYITLSIGSGVTPLNSVIFGVNPGGK
jgi:hypothetical protein